jgi:phosphoenolpyruvate---glycerone phosphotransferase subunit DhaL
MKFDERAMKELIEAIAQTVFTHTDELTDLDRAIGDADHGVNMDRGFKAVVKDIDAISAKPLGPALAEIGKTLIFNVGGASGPLFGKLFSTVGRQLSNGDAITHQQLVAACDEAIKVIKALGKSDVGEKTMLDVLVPVVDELRGDGSRAVLPRLRDRAQSAAAATIPMMARRGRASFLGERSRGHMDPGARSSELIIEAVCGFLENCRESAAIETNQSR